MAVTKSYVFLVSLIGSLLVLVLNVAILSGHSDDFGNGHVMIGPGFWTSRAVVEETQQHAPPPALTMTQQQPRRHRYPKTFLGIISSDTYNDAAYRKRHRILFQVWNDTRVCSLPDFRARSPEEREPCQLVYSFIIGANPDPNGPTELLENTTELPIERPKPIEAKFHADVNDPDVTLLNIQENMNEGKSQTFFYFASLIMEQYGLDYAMKFDADSILHLHDFFLFAHNHLPPPPYNVNIIVGALRDKAGWPAGKPEDLPRKESFWGNEFEGVHLYIAGQCYLMSMDLCKFTATEAPFSKLRIAEGGYLEGHEDHDVSAMIFHSPTPIHMITIGKSQRFWEHPVKGQPRWDRIQRRETARMTNAIFEGKNLRLY